MMASLFPSFPTMALPWVDLPDSLETLTTVATQLQNIVSAAIGHPVGAIALLLLSIVLLQILADLVKRVLKTGVAFVLKLPLLLSQWLWQKAVKPQPSPANRVDQLMARLDALRQEQDEVVAELKSLVSVGTQAGQAIQPEDQEAV